MISASDKAYQETKRIMLGKAEMHPAFKALAAWIDQTYDVKTINIVYDTIDEGRRPRLEICFETFGEVEKFKEGPYSNLDEKKQSDIAQKLNQLMQEREAATSHRFLDFFGKTENAIYETENILVIYGAFAPIARAEATANIPKQKITELKNSLEKDVVWEISHLFAQPVFFLFTDEQVKTHEHSETRRQWADKFWQILSEYDTFGYFKRENFSIALDSKENFHKKYNGNWADYCRYNY